MPPKRKRRTSIKAGLATNNFPNRPQYLKHDWDWVGTEVIDVHNISHDHVLRTCGLSKANNNPLCQNVYEHQIATSSTGKLESARGDIIVVSDDTRHCSKSLCKNNPFCLNYVGQEKWEDEAKIIRKLFNKFNIDEQSPSHEGRDARMPVGLKNLGATCYAKASLQVWFRDLAFRNGVYDCQPPNGVYGEKFKESPIFQLQVTFAALQSGSQAVFNPNKLVESLQLSTTEQQDAQEFSKLFLSHLDEEFKKQVHPHLQSLISKQFEGKQVYGTICDHCQNNSERESGFLELEITFEDGSRLEDCIKNSLKPEKLVEENQYHCPHCETLRDAVRYNELQELPPVLHFALLRFVYNVSTMARKKMKHTIIFPSTIDMNPYLSSRASNEGRKESQMYELRGVLLHKGASAYHGHYEAQIYDPTNESWFQFNDETVTKIWHLGDDTGAEKSDKNSSKQAKSHSRKRRKVNDTSGENGAQQTPTFARFDIQSKDAYMLVYTRRSSDQSDIPGTPPIDALSVVNSLNADYERKCQTFETKQQQLKHKIETFYHRVKGVYQSWHVRDYDEPMTIVSRHALESWLSVECIKGVFGEEKWEIHKEDEDIQMDASPRMLAIDDILCDHGKLHPIRSMYMKCIKLDAVSEILRATNCSFQPQLTQEDVCHLCMVDGYLERLYEREHPQNVHTFLSLSEGLVGDGKVWISKLWLKDWESPKPKMHAYAQSDPPPDSDIFKAHVQCEHGNLSLPESQRQLLTQQAAAFLQRLFPLWKPLPADRNVCEECQSLKCSSKQTKREIRKQADEEKALLLPLLYGVIPGSSTMPEGEPCALIQPEFLRCWRRWVNHPYEKTRPVQIDNTAFICEHNLLSFDPNHTSSSSCFVAIAKAQWDILLTLYSGGPSIFVEKQPDQANQNNSRIIHNLVVCEICNHKRLHEWETAEIIIRLWGAKDPLEYTERSDPSQRLQSPDESNKSVVTYMQNRGLRQSKRVKDIKHLGEYRTVVITRATTVKDIKVNLQTELGIPTINQQIYFRGTELTENTLTMLALRVNPQDTFDMREVEEVYPLDSDIEETGGSGASENGGRKVNATAKRKRGFERGFDGTLLLGGLRTASSSTSSLAMDVEGDRAGTAGGVSCTACTFINSVAVCACELCGTPLAS